MFLTCLEIFDRIDVMTSYMGSIGQFVWVKSEDFEVLTLISDHFG